MIVIIVRTSRVTQRTAEGAGLRCFQITGWAQPFQIGRDLNYASRLRLNDMERIHAMHPGASTAHGVSIMAC